MTIKEVEERTGLTRSSIRFYEKEKLIIPSRNESNGYRDYSEENVRDIEKIAYLRTIRISLDSIRNVIDEKVTMREVLKKQRDILNKEIEDCANAKALCEEMLSAENLNYKSLEIEQYVKEVKDYWHRNASVFKLDSVSFIYLWRSFITWIVITILCLGIGAISYTKLPQDIPIQWSHGVVTSTVSKPFIFVFPVACVLIRYLLRPCIYVKLKMNNQYEELVAEYLSNYLCFVALSVEIFLILFTFGVVKNIVFVLFMDTLVLISLLVLGIMKMNDKNRPV